MVLGITYKKLGCANMCFTHFSHTPVLHVIKFREAALVTWQACGTLWGGRTIFLPMIQGGEEIFDATAGGKK